MNNDQEIGWHSNNSAIVQYLIPKYISPELRHCTGKQLRSLEGALLDCIELTEANIIEAKSHLRILKNRLEKIVFDDFGESKLHYTPTLNIRIASEGE